MLDYFKSIAAYAATIDEQVGSGLANNPAVTKAELPAWTNTFSWVLKTMQRVPETKDFGFIHSERPIPFEALFIPVVIEARLRRDRLFNEPAPFSAQALDSLDRMLLGQLSDLSAVALFEAFVIFRHLRQSSFLSFNLGQSTNDNSLYHYFVLDFRTNRIKDFFLENPILAQWSATVIEQWIENTSEIIQHFQSDRQRLAKYFNHGKDPGVVQEIELGLSDPHQGGRTVGILTFAEDLKLVYKPKDMGIDVAWSEFLHWLECHDAPYQFRAPQVLDRSGYGWTEFITPIPCTTEAEVERFFQRAGGLLCLFHLLQATDFHYENVIASAVQPVAIDLETLMCPWQSPVLLQRGLGEISEVAVAYFRNSVLATNYLPDWLMGQGGQQHLEVGGLSLVDRGQVETYRFKNTNRDGMQRVKHTVVLPPSSNLPCLNGEYPSPKRYCEAITTGFAKTYLFLIAHRQHLLEPTGGIACFKGKVVRAVLRPTENYALLLRRRTARPYLRNGLDWSKCLKVLSPIVSDEPDSVSLSLAQVAAEREALSRLDIPYFTTLTDSLDLQADGQQQIPNYFTICSFDQVIARIKELNEATMHRQIELIRDVISSTEGMQRLSAPIAWVQNPERENSLSPEQVFEQANRFVNLLEQEAIRTETMATWLGPMPLQGEQIHRLGIIGADLYSGSSGIALFLAAFAALEGGIGKRKLALAALEPLRQQLADPQSGTRLLQQIGLGGATGLGSAIYVLVKVAHLLDEPTLLEDALLGTALLTEERIKADSSLDVMAGVAGTILSLSALYRVCPEDSALQRLHRCGQHLLQYQRVLDTGQQAWRTFGQIPLTGFSHGSAGIVLALLRLYQVNREEVFLQAALKGLGYERSLFSSEQNNWPDLRRSESQSDSPTFPCQWCHGASGIGLARLGMLEILPDLELQTEIDAALKTTENFPISALDHLCCGNFGRLEFLFTAGQRLGRADLIHTAQSRAAQLLALTAQGRHFGWQTGHDRRNPGFFTGFSGVGYTLLRFLEPDKLPSILLWD